MKKKKLKKQQNFQSIVKRPKNIKKILFIKTKKSTFLLYFDIKSIITTYKLKKIMKKKIKKIAKISRAL